AFYFDQFKWRMENPTTRKWVTAVMPRFFEPVGTGLQPQEEVDFTVAYVLNGEEGLAAARRIDATFAKVPGFERGFNAIEQNLVKVRARLGDRAPKAPIEDCELVSVE